MDLITKKDLKRDHRLLADWYKKHSRPLPWRQSKDPYKIWLSEVMLQQTTVVAVIPYFEKFTQRFPTVHSLATAPENEVMEAWAGLGYYSRARNLHKAAKHISANGFPQTAAELIELSGFGPYTSRAVASIAFNEPVGVLDGNVIRVLTRRHGLKIQWWNNKEKNLLQQMSDDLAQIGEPDVINQALMELGATVCTPQKTMCLLCPWSKNCVSFEKNLVSELPLKKPRKESEVWVWEVSVHYKSDQVALIKNDYAPFLKGQMIFPGKISRQKNKPKAYDAKHSITHHNIFIQIKKQKGSNLKQATWVEIKNIKKVNPSSLLTKILKQVDS